jgi:hypothetical protein
MNMDKPEPAVSPVWLTLDPSSTTLLWSAHSATLPQVVLPLGVQSLATACFSQPRPSPLELERAIDQVEDALDGLGPLNSTHHVLITADPALVALAREHGQLTPSGVWGLTREQVEALFQRLASAALGHPSASKGLVADQAAYARLLILRELMHHLKFDAVHARQ